MSTRVTEVDRTVVDRDVVDDDHHHFLPTAGGYMLGLLRLLFGFTFLWAFLDKTFGLGHATPSDKSWLDGNSPTSGYLGHAAKGPFVDFYHGLANNTFIDWLFMLGLLGIGLTLLLGVGVRIGAICGALMYLFMYGASLWPENNPFIDDHLTGLVSMLVFATIPAAADYLGLGRMWRRMTPSFLH